MRLVLKYPTPFRHLFTFLIGILLFCSAVQADDSMRRTDPPDLDEVSPVTADRAYWCDIANRLSIPVLEALAQRRLQKTMPVETRPRSQPGARSSFTHLEALGRLLCGIAPWLELGADESPEGLQRDRLAELARAGIDAATDPDSPDYMNFSTGAQPLVDAAFLAQAFIRAPVELWEKLDPRVQANVIAALRETRRVEPHDNNWILFGAEVEAFLHMAGYDRDEKRLSGPLRKFQDWYLGDGLYGDGPAFHWDYYNSFVIHPMLFDVAEMIGNESAELGQIREETRRRLVRYAAIQERLIAPDGSYPAIGRSLAYRCGAFQVLALAAQEHILPKGVTPGQARKALTSVIRKTLEAPGTWDSEGWLRLGLAGHQPLVAETYISTGSLYLCSAVLLPLGLPPEDPFWSEPEAPTAWETAWQGMELKNDKAL